LAGVKLHKKKSKSGGEDRSVFVCGLGGLRLGERGAKEKYVFLDGKESAHQKRIFSELNIVFGDGDQRSSMLKDFFLEVRGKGGE